MAYKVGDRVTLTEDVPIVSFKAQAVLRKGQHGTVTGDFSNDLVGVHFDAVGLTVLIGRNHMVHTVDELAVLRAQLAARDKALDAVLELLQDNSTISESSDTRMFRERCLLRLANNGVHPK